MDLSQLQREAADWANRNYLSGQPHQSLLGVIEEAGEFAEALTPLILSTLLGRISHAQLKTEDGIRGTEEQHAVEAQDAIADMTIFMARYCERRGWDYGQIVERTWAKVKQRDWTKDKMTGGDLEANPPQQHPLHPEGA